MLVEVKVPILAESITEGTLVTWRRRPGEFVRRDEVLVELETDKVVLEITAPVDGVLKEIRCGDGETVKSGETVAAIDSEAKASMQSARPETASIASTEPAAAARPASTEEDVKLSPAVRKLLDEHHLSAKEIPASGRDGRITKADVLSYLEGVAPIAEEAGVVAGESLSPDRAEKRVPMTRLRARVAERLKEAQNTAAILTTFNEVNMQPVMDLRARYKDNFEKTHSVRLGFMSFFTKATVEALKQFPVINASVDGNDIVYHGYYDIGVAVSSPRGLVVPVLRDADTLSFAQIEQQVVNFGRKAKEGKLSLDELTGGNFTITNGGVFGSLLSTPILNPPQSAILGMHKIQMRPVVEDEAIVARPMMYLALSYDHRIVDGHEAVLFLVKIKELLEDPARLLLQI